MRLREQPDVLVEDINTLYPQMCRSVGSTLRRLRCQLVEACSADVSTAHLMSESSKEKGHLVIVEETVFIYYPQAENQRRYFFGCLHHRARKHQSRCHQCEFFRRAGSTIAEDNARADADEPRTQKAGAVSPSDPEKSLAALELIEKFLANIPDPKKRQAVRDLLLGETCKSIAQQHGVTPATVRQWFSRAKTRFARLFGIKLSRVRKKK